MTKFALLGFLCLVFYDCNYFKSKKEADNEDSTVPTKKDVNPYSFKNYSKAIKTLKLPFKDTCYDTIAVQRLKMPDSILKLNSGIHSTPQIVGKVAETEDYVAILYCIPADVQLPILKTFTKKGEKISSLRLLIGKCCGEDEDCNGMSCLEITKDLRIILKDSVVTFDRSKKKYNKLKNKKLTKKIETYRIDTDGKIVKVEGDLRA